MRNFVLACLAAVSVQAQDAMPEQAPDAMPEQANQQEFLQWAASNGKSYATSGEMNMRMELWNKSKAEIDALNAKSKTATFAANFLSDYTEEEKQAMFGLLVVENPARVLVSEGPMDEDTHRKLFTTTIDWSEQNTTPVKDQGSCGSCVPFANTTCVEARWSIKNSNATPVRLSEQHAMDCSKNLGDYGNLGCRGGWPWAQYDFMVDYGVVNYDTYPIPYKERD